MINDNVLEILNATCIEFKYKTKEEILEWIDNIFKLYNLPYEIIEEGVVFKVEDTLITDVKGNQEPITDMYFKVLWNGNLLVRRFSFTFSQYLSGYKHSHIGTGDMDSWSNKICFGGIIKTTNFSKTLVSFLCIHKVFCSTESTNTTPYYQISKLKVFKGTLKNNVSHKESNDFPKYLEIVENIRIRRDNEKISFDITHNEEKLEKLAIENNWLSYYDGDKYYISVLNSLPENTEVKEYDTSFVFKGVPIKKRIYVQDTDLLPKPQVCGVVVKFFQDKIKIRLIKKLHEAVNSNAV